MNHWSKMVEILSTLSESGFPPGTVRKWKDGEYVKQKDGEWTPKDGGAPKSNKLPATERSKINDKLSKVGGDGNTRFQSVGKALNTLFSTLAEFGIEPDETLNAHLFMGDEGRRTIQLAYTNSEDSFSPVSIQNSMLAITWSKGNTGYEVVAYLS